MYSTLLGFTATVLAGCIAIWSVEFAFPNSVASAILLFALTVIGLWIVRPGWNLLPRRFSGYW